MRLNWDAKSVVNTAKLSQLSINQRTKTTLSVRETPVYYLFCAYFNHILPGVFRAKGKEKI